MTFVPLDPADSNEVSDGFPEDGAEEDKDRWYAVSRASRSMFSGV